MSGRWMVLVVAVLNQSWTSKATPDLQFPRDAQPVPFLPTSPRLSQLDVLLNRRQQDQQGNCQPNYISCASLSAPEACCRVGTSCARDAAGTIACCPNGNVCGGNVGGGGGGGAGAGSSTVIPGLTTPFTNPTMTMTQPGIPTITSAAYSTLPNAYYPFPLIPGTYANSAACLSAYTLCQQQSTSCFAALAGQNGITVNALGGGGVTQAGINGLPQESASAICNSLSATGCRSIQSTQCAGFGSGDNGNGQIQNGRGPRETGHAGIRYAAAFGVVGAMGFAV